MLFRHRWATGPYIWCHVGPPLYRWHYHLTFLKVKVSFSLYGWLPWIRVRVSSVSRVCLAYLQRDGGHDINRASTCCGAPERTAQYVNKWWWVVNIPDRLLQQYTAPKAILSGITILLAVHPVLWSLCDYSCDQMNQATKGITSSLNALVNLLEYFGHFLSYLNIYTRSRYTPSMDQIAINIMLDLLTTLTLVT